MVSKRFQTCYKISEGKIVSEIYGPVKEAEGSRIRTRVEIKDVPQGADIVKFIEDTPTEVVWSCRKNEKTKYRQNKSQQL